MKTEEPPGYLAQVPRRFILRNFRNQSNMTVMKAWILVSLVLLAPAFAQASEVVAAKVRYEAGRYILHLEVEFNAPVASIFAVITDYGKLDKLSPKIMAGGLERKVSAGDIVYTRIKACWLCRTIDRTEIVVANPPHELEATVIPQKGELKYGVTTWSLSERGSGAFLVYHTEIEPDFWVPAFVAREAFKKRMRADTLESFEIIEQLARER